MTRPWTAPLTSSRGAWNRGEADEAEHFRRSSQVFENSLTSGKLAIEASAANTVDKPSEIRNSEMHAKWGGKQHEAEHGAYLKASPAIRMSGASRAVIEKIKMYRENPAATKELFIRAQSHLQVSFW
jgi:hypothetical protein